MSIPRLALYIIVLLSVATVLTRRTLTAAPRAFRFREEVKPEIAALTVQVEGRTGIPLSELLRASEMTAFLVIKDDAIVFEAYDHGYDRATPSLSFSMAKSVLSLLVGCALDDGILRSIDQPVTDYVPELADRGFKAVTLRQLLQMTSGVTMRKTTIPMGSTCASTMQITSKRRF